MRSSVGHKCHIPRIESTHVMVALHATIHDSAIALLSDAFFYNRRVSPVWETPVLWRDLPPLDCGLCVIAHGLFECRVEVAVIEEDIGVVEPPVEMSLERLDGLDDAVKLFVPRQDHNCGIRSGAVCLGFEAAYCKGLVVLFADFLHTVSLLSTCVQASSRRYTVSKVARHHQACS